MLSKNINQYAEDKTFIFEYDMNNMLPELKKNEDTKWLSEIPSQCLQQKCQDLGTALKQCSKQNKNKKGFPKFKSRKTDSSGIRFPMFKLEGNRIVLPKMKSNIKINLHRELQGNKGAITIYKDSVGDYFASIIVNIGEDFPEKTSVIENYIGIDVGLKEFAVTSDAEIIANPKFLKKSSKKLAKSQRKASKKTKDSNNKKKANKKVAKIHRHIKNQRKDFVNKLACSIVKSNDLIAIESLNIKGMIKNHKLSKSISDVGWGLFTSALKRQSLYRSIKHINSHPNICYILLQI